MLKKMISVSLDVVVATSMLSILSIATVASVIFNNSYEEKKKQKINGLVHLNNKRVETIK